ncbi:MAG: hypothetical protein JZU65_16135 [Chlorobium sp.]|nr:hypothetical protein [Chlorobium sp.]
MMLDDEIFANCSDDSMEKKKIPGYVRNLLTNEGIVVLEIIPGKMIQTFVRQTGVMWNVHIAISKKCKLTGAERMQLSEDACNWMVHIRGARKFVANIPRYNKCALRFAAACGMKRTGVLTSAIRKNGALVDMVVYQSTDDAVQKLVRRA